MRILLVGYGKMGRLVGELAPQYDCEVAGIVDPPSPKHSGPIDSDKWRGIDAAIDFSQPDAVPGNLRALARLGVNVVVGTTGWGSHEAALKQDVASSGIGVVTTALGATALANSRTRGARTDGSPRTQMASRTGLTSPSARGKYTPSSCDGVSA